MIFDLFFYGQNMCVVFLNGDFVGYTATLVTYLCMLLGISSLPPRHHSNYLEQCGETEIPNKDIKPSD